MSEGSARRVACWSTVLVLALFTSAARGAPLAAVMFEDAPALGSAALLPAYHDALGTPLTHELTGRLPHAVAAIYRERGYLPPAPRVVRTRGHAGIVVMEVREPHVVLVRLDGREQTDFPGLQSFIVELRAMRPLGRSGFDAWLGRVNGAGFPVQGSLIRVRADSPGYVASLRIDDRRWQGLMHVDNRGPAQLGREIAQLSLGYRWPNERLGHLRFDAAAAADHERLRYLGISGGHRVNDRGDRLQWSYSRSRSELPVGDTVRRVDYRRERVEVELSVPLVHRLRQRAGVTASLRSYELDQFLDDGRRLRRDRIRVAGIGYDLAMAGDGGGRHTVDVAVLQGLPFLGSSVSPPRAEEDFTAIAGRYGYGRGFAGQWHLRGDLHVQAADDRLPASERFFVGGRALGGAFDPAVLSGDEGLGARLGVDRRIRLAGIPMTAFSYYDHAYVRSRGDSRPSDDVGSAGLGLQGSYGKLTWSVELAVPVKSPRTADVLEDGTRAFFSLTQRF